uniref:DNA replication ATP-dependent helicase/nuclease DNA2 n=1 Tax=Romanomermis culicivorax TaxID=13658 RepID=A0A915I764_ROMCU
GHERKIIALSSINQQSYTLILKGVWYDCCLKSSDPFRIFVNFGDLDEEHSPIIFDNNSKNLILVYPDKLMSANEIASSAFCRRKSVLNDKFRCSDDVTGNKAMLLGTLLHRLFQKALGEQWNGVKRLESEFDSFLKDADVLEAMYFCNVSSVIMQEDARAYFKKLDELLVGKFSRQKSDLFQNPANGRHIQFENVQDIEENIWCPRYGLRGKIDVTLQVRDNIDSTENLPTILPLELKTGKTSQSVEHRAQVLLYNLLLSQNHLDVSDNGLLLYLKDGHLSHLKVNYRDIRGLFHLRNEMARSVELFGSIDIENKLNFELPESLPSTRFCPSCPQALNCCLMSKLESEVRETDDDENRQQFIDNVTSHLTEKYLTYFQKWLKWTCLENAEQNSKRPNMSDLWSKKAAERAADSNALDSLHFEKMITSGENCQNFQLKLRGKNIPFGIFEVGDYCIVSNVTKNQIAVASGIISVMSDQEIVLNVSKSYDFDSNNEFSLDHYNSSASNLRSQLGILTKLMTPSEHSRKICELIIDLKDPTFQEKLIKNTILKSKSHLSRLNKQQILAVVKALRANDYTLIRGLPGTGENSVLVYCVF